MVTQINDTLLRLSKRAENIGRDRLIQTFVDIGPLFALVSTTDHQVIFGRRGTGKTHALAYLSHNKESAGDAVAMVDLRNIGSSAGLYTDETVSLSERATRLLVDTLSTIHGSVLDFCVENSERFNLSETGPLLDEIADSITQVKVVGTVETAELIDQKETADSGGSAGFGFSGANPSASFGTKSAESISISEISSTKRSGLEKIYINFGSTGAAFRHLLEKLNGARLWVLLDEWSSIPVKLQPFLGDLLRRSIFPISGLTVKIAAIEHRSDFKLSRESGEYIGIELGADASADVNLDDFMVFDNDSERAIEFFQNLIGSHVEALSKELGTADQIPPNPAQIIQMAFTEKRALEEFVRSCEGVPRDAINIISLAAQRALSNPISVNNVRIASKNWYQRDKEKAVSSDAASHELLHKIVDDVIGKRKARAFLLRSDVRNEQIDNLYDARLIHVLKRGISTHDQPGVRYDAYKLDYGCYVDLLTTQKAPQGLLPMDGNIDEYVDVPPDDYRSIRRAILTLGNS